MIEYLLVGLGFVIALLAYLLHGATNNRLKDIERELEDWSGVYDIKREVDSSLSDSDTRQRLRNKYNKK